MRLERETLLDLFYDEVMPNHRVQVDVLCHGVTRERLRKQVESANGYHVVHWSGHGHHDLLELYGEEGDADLLTGSELLALFTEAGGFLPNLIFLAAMSELAGDGRYAFDDPEALAEALRAFEDGRADFSDYLIGASARSRGVRTTYTFDRKLEKDEGFTCLRPSVATAKHLATGTVLHGSRVPVSSKGLLRLVATAMPAAGGFTRIDRRGGMRCPRTTKPRAALCSASSCPGSRSSSRAGWRR
jgi:hypothetical protein